MAFFLILKHLFGVVLIEKACNRCGMCCWYEDKDGIMRKCRYLVSVGKRTLCRVYKNRLGRVVGIGKEGKVLCADRTLDHKQNHPFCPYNRYN